MRDKANHSNRIRLFQQEQEEVCDSRRLLLVCGAVVAGPFRKVFKGTEILNVWSIHSELYLVNTTTEETTTTSDNYQQNEKDKNHACVVKCTAYNSSGH
ncbi:hypothetical protein [Paenibacillus sp. sgz302251]|uniref:hypothetical protein n=1 Tax=Paenibacillus sp. sgz302251 TaxID=3414493 RepID=UPI003C7B642D